MWQRPPLWKRQLVWGRVGGEGWFNFYFIVSNWFFSFNDNVFVYWLWDWEVRPGVTRKTTHPHLTIFYCNFQERAMPSARQRYIDANFCQTSSKSLPNIIVTSQVRLCQGANIGAKKEVKVVHNYGHGGSGVTLSWGCAGEVLPLPFTTDWREDFVDKHSWS